MLHLFFAVLVLFSLAFSEESLIVKSKIIKQEYNREELSRIKARLAEVEKNQKYIMESLSQSHKTHTQHTSISPEIQDKIDRLLDTQTKIYAKLEELERYTKKQLLIQTMIQFVIFSIFFVFMVLLYKYKKDTASIETKIDDKSSKIDVNKKETLKFLMEKAKDNPRIAEAVKSILEEKKGSK